MVDNIAEVIENAKRKLAEQGAHEEKDIPAQEKKARGTSPPYITVGNGLATKQFPEGVSIDAFEVFNQLSKAQRGLFIKFKNILVQQNFDNWIAKKSVSNPNIVRLTVGDHDDIKVGMSKNLNGTSLEKVGVLKKIRNGEYMLNPYIFIPARNFHEIANIWEELPVKKRPSSEQTEN